jgi:hypothetical protein
MNNRFQCGVFLSHSSKDKPGVCIPTSGDCRDGQPFPKRGRLAQNRSLSGLKKRIHENEDLVYCYVISTIKRDVHQFRQEGCAPNFQGGRISLCTCKHYMRTFMDTNSWRGKWIAGFSGKAVGGGCNALVCLMKVGHAFESHYDLWKSAAIPFRTKEMKQATHDRFGDLFEPKAKVLRDNERFDPQNYHPPTRCHCHKETWNNDIRYEGCKGRNPSLLVGNVKYSFLWDRPVLMTKLKIPRGQKKLTMQEFLSHLKNWTSK